MSDAAQMTKIVRPFSRGRVTIPAEFRKRLGIGEGAMLRITLNDGELRITPIQDAETPQIDAAIAEVRKEQGRNC